MTLKFLFSENKIGCLVEIFNLDKGLVRNYYSLFHYLTQYNNLSWGLFQKWHLFFRKMATIHKIRVLLLIIPHYPWRSAGVLRNSQ